MPRLTQGNGTAGSSRALAACWLGIGALVLPFLIDSCTALSFVPFPRVALSFGATPFWIGVLGFVPRGAFVLTCLAAGGFSDRWGRRRTLFAGACGYFMALALAWQASSLAALMLAAALLGIGGGFFWPAMEGAIGDVYGHHSLGRGLLFFNLGWTGGISLGAVAGGRLSDQDLFLPFVAGMGVSTAAMLLILFWPPHGAMAAGEEHPSDPQVSSAVADYFLLLARIANFCSFFALACVRTLFTPLGEALGFSGSLIGALMALVSVAQAAAFVPLARSHRWQYRFWPLLAAECAILGAMLGTGRSSAPWMFALFMTTLGVGAGVAYTASLFYSLNRPAERGRMSALHEAILGTGAMAGPLLGGVVADLFGLRAPFFLAGVVVGCGLLLQAVLRKRWALWQKA